MLHTHQHPDVRRLLSDGLSDEEVERLTGLSLASIILLRAEAAAAAFDGRTPPRAAGRTPLGGRPFRPPPPQA